MKLNNCEIIFSKLPEPLYYAGEVVSGRVELRIDHPKKLGLTLIIFGNTKCRWMETRGSGKQRKTITFTSEKAHFITVTNLLISDANPQGEPTTLSEGLHSYNFSFVLPPNLPSSFLGTYGRVKYAAKVVSKKQYKFDRNFKAEFAVISIFDLNLNYEYRTPFKLSTLKTFTFLFFNSGSLHIHLELPFTAFVTGQVIPMSCRLVKEGKITVSCVKMYLEKLTEYRANSPHDAIKTESFVIAKVKTEDLVAAEEWQLELPMTVPITLPTSTAEHCDFIHRKYELKLVMVVPGFHTNPVIHIRVTIGTIALVSDTSFASPQMLAVSPLIFPASPGSTPYQQYPPFQSPSTSISSAPPLQDIAGSFYGRTIQPSVPELPPPTYDEAQAMFGNSSKQNFSDAQNGGNTPEKKNPF